MSSRPFFIGTLFIVKRWMRSFRCPDPVEPIGGIGGLQKVLKWGGDK